MNTLGIVIAVLAIFAGLLGIVGSFLPVLPGPPFSWIGMLLVFLWGKGANGVGDRMSLTLLIVMLVVTIVVTALDYIVPAMFAKRGGASKAASSGALIGSILGMLFFPPWGIILGVGIGAFAGEIIANGRSEKAIPAAWNAFLGFILSTGLKLIACVVMFTYIIIYAF